MKELPSNNPPPQRSSPTPRKRPRDSSDDEGFEDNETMTIDSKENNTTTNNDKTKITGNEMDDKNGKDFKTDETIVVRGLRLEAIFHPKFDNERSRKGPGKKADSSSDIRSTMLKKLGIGSGTEACKGTGHLEVSLKHSGSLVLWSGSTRYYSKNSACNEFTRTAEILLRQRFETVRAAMASSTNCCTSIDENNSNDTNPHHFCSYDDCSRFVSQHRYTIAFEVVTAEMLGDHGQIPNIDYVVVTAVADRSQERFLSTTQVLEFCHRFRLPHNDVWTFFPPSAMTTNNATATKSKEVPSAAETLFRLYDTSLRETGFTETTVKALTDIADVTIPSPVPHSIYQGSICEGFIVRYVDDANGGPAKEKQKLEGLARAARDILEEVPPPTTTTPSSSSSSSSSSLARAPDSIPCDPVLSADLRALHQSIPYVDSDECDEKSQQNHKPPLSAVALQRRRALVFSERLEKLLQDGDESESDGQENMRHIKRPRRRRQRHDLKKVDKEKESNRRDGGKSMNYHLPTLTKSLIDSSDTETKRIALLLQTLDGLRGGGVTYTWMEKQDNSHDDNTNNKSSSRQQNRLYCIIHVHNDSTFFKFQSLQSSSDMTLFRGFCVEILLSDGNQEERVNWGGGETGEFPSERGSGCSKEEKRQQFADGVSGAPLMLKMKLLPYMVRTFVCRNLLNTIQKKGPEEFERMALGLLEKWKMSSDARERWMPFFRGWASYVLQYEAKQEQKEHRNDSQLGPLTNFSYLRHLEHFTKLYESGEFRTASPTTVVTSPEFQTFVCFVSQSTEVSSALANHFANYFNIDENSEDSKMVVCSLGEAAKYRRSKSCITYANVADLTKGIKKFICDKKLAKRSILILFGSNKDEIIALTKSVAEKEDEMRPPSWMDILSEGDGKRLVNLWKPWKKFPCAKLVELGRSTVELEPRTEDSAAAVIASVNDKQEITDAIQGVGRSLLEQETRKQSDPSRGGILVFFPGIPGCGKSSLQESSISKLEEEMGKSQKEVGGELFSRQIHVKEGDKIGKNFWNIIEDLLSDDNILDGKSPPLVIADKNAPPASWPKLGQIGHESNAIMIPVLPDSSVLETTTIEGSIQPNGTPLPHASHFYPFSLKFLAVSLSRVLSRPAGEHAGKLDSGFPMACMVVVQFFSFYRYIGADTFQEKMNEKFDKDGAFSIKMLEPVELPFLTASARDQALPVDLKKLLEEALKLRHGHDKNKLFKVKKEDAQMIELEGRLRSCIEMHKETIRTMTVNLEATKDTFAEQITSRIKSLGNKTVVERTLMNGTPEDDVSTSLKLVSLDIDSIGVHKLLEKHQESGAIINFFEFAESLSSAPKTDVSDTAMTDADKVCKKARNGGSDGITTERYPAPNFVEKTHVTMSFAGEKNPADTLVANFRHLQGQEVAVSVTGFLWSSTNAAFAIKISSSTVGEDSVCVPPCENAFAHITVWCAPDVKASLSNQLPNLVESGKASRIDFAHEDLLVGKISFWNHKNEPFQV